MAIKTTVDLGPDGRLQAAAVKQHADSYEAATVSVSGGDNPACGFASLSCSGAGRDQVLSLNAMSISHDGDEAVVEVQSVTVRHGQPPLIERKSYPLSAFQQEPEE
ncbi:MAG: hypothetical protein RL095_2096 [Verrucomicrobiota bacterium]|jgi:hypothetical protein